MKIKINILLTLVLLTLVVTSPLYAQSTKPALKKEKFHLDKKIEEAVGYTQAVKVGNTIYISGINSGGDAPTQIKNVYDGLQKVLESYGLGFQHVVKENLYTTDLEGIKQQQELRKKYYKGDYPAATWVQVSQLYDANLKLEVELIAVLP